MDADRFDRLLRAFADKPSRRDVARGLAALLAGSLAAVLPGVDHARDAAAKPKKKKPKPKRCEPVTQSFCPSPKPSGDCCDVLGETCTECGCCPNASPKCCTRGKARICCPANFECCGVGNGTQCCDPSFQTCTACGCCPDDLPKCCEESGLCAEADAECCGKDFPCDPSLGERCCAYGKKGKKKQRKCCTAQERCHPTKGCVPSPCALGAEECPSDAKKCCNPLAGEQCASRDGCCDTLDGGKKLCDGKWCCDNTEVCAPGVGCQAACAADRIPCPSLNGSFIACCKPEATCCNGTCCLPEGGGPVKCCPGRTACYDPNAPCPA